MQTKVSKNYSVSFTDEEIVDAICYWLSNYRSRSDLIDIVSVIRNTEVKVSRKDRQTCLKFTQEE